MNETHKMNGLTKGLVITVIAVHFMFFLLEAVLWMQPNVYMILVGQLSNPIDLGYLEQALVLKNLFINQGFYNLFLACIGVGGYYLAINKRYTTGYTMILVICFCGTGAGIVLLCSTKAYVIAIIQFLSSVLAFVQVMPLHNKLMAQSKL